MNSTRTDFDLELKEGFSLNELLLLAWINGKHVDTSEYPQYFSKNLEIEETILRLFDDDCLDIIEGEAAIDFLTLEKLNDIFKENKLQSFKDYEKAKNFFKKEFSLFYIQNIIGTGSYCLMEKGKHLVDKYKSRLPYKKVTMENIGEIEKETEYVSLKTHIIIQYKSKM